MHKDSQVQTITIERVPLKEGRRSRWPTLLAVFLGCAGLGSVSFGLTLLQPKAALADPAVANRVLQDSEPEPEVTDDTTASESTASDAIEVDHAEVDPVEPDAAQPTEPSVGIAESDAASDAELDAASDAAQTTESNQAADLGAATSVDVQTTEFSSARDRVSQREERLQLLLEADQYYLGGQFEAARQLYQEAKAPLPVELELKTQSEPNPDGGIDPAVEVVTQPEPFSDPELLSPAGRVFWREYQAGVELDLETRIQVPLKLLAERHPEYLPAHVLLADQLNLDEQPEAALAILETATAQYPNQAVLVEAHIEQLTRLEEWIDAALLARQFALFNPDHPDVEQFQELANQNIAAFQSDIRDRLVANTVANVIVGAAGYALTGGLYGPFSAIDSAMMLIRGETGIGRSISNSLQKRLDLVDDPDIVDYVDELGQRLARVAGRDEFEYEFHILREPDLNAFALPGGKIFINAGAIAKTNSEAELAGLLAHELAHAVLSHGFQLVSEGNLLANVSQFVPYGGFAANLIVLNYSRNMERQADELGTQILAAAGYAADGMYNLMQLLAAENEARGENVYAWLSTHPQTSERLENIQRQIINHDLDRYAYEGVKRHQVAQAKAKALIAELEKDQIDYNEVYQQD
ncbi:MAG: M48 family metallopeptidase [Cyanobacteria bacterium P01_H01_bin.121]